MLPVCAVSSSGGGGVLGGGVTARGAFCARSKTGNGETDGTIVDPEAGAELVKGVRSTEVARGMRNCDRRAGRAI